MSADVEHKTLAEALVAAQAEMPAVEKDSMNPHFKSKFTSLDHLIAKTRPVLNRHGLAMTQEPCEGLSGGCSLRTTLIHASGELRSTVMPLILGKDDMQGLGSALTYAKRYAWAAALGISTDEDDDGNAASAQAQNTPRERTGATERRTPGPARAAAPPKAENGSDGFDRDKAFKAAKAIEKRLIAAGLTEEAFKAGVESDYGTPHVSALTDEQLADLVAKLREAEKAIPA